MARAGEHLSEETKRKMSLARIGRHHSEETKRKMRVAGTGRCLSEETKRKLSLAKMGRPPTIGFTGRHHTKESKQKMSLAGIGHPPRTGMTGKHHSEETKRKMSLANKGKNKGRHWSEEAKQAIGARLRGRKFSEEHRMRIGLARARQTPPMLGLKHSTETKEKMRIGALAHRRRTNGFRANIGKDEEAVLYNIEVVNGITLIRQFKVFEYIIDGYCKKTNTAYEIDEPYHRGAKQSAYDENRQRKIEQFLQCKFVRIKLYRGG
jgi:very-short-patch-repair endonuclease